MLALAPKVPYPFCRLPLYPNRKGDRMVEKKRVVKKKSQPSVCPYCGLIIHKDMKLIIGKFGTPSIKRPRKKAAK